MPQLHSFNMIHWLETGKSVTPDTEPAPPAGLTDINMFSRCRECRNDKKKTWAWLFQLLHWPQWSGSYLSSPAQSIMGNQIHCPSQTSANISSSDNGRTKLSFFIVPVWENNVAESVSLSWLRARCSTYWHGGRLVKWKRKKKSLYICNSTTISLYQFIYLHIYIQTDGQTVVEMIGWGE